MTNIVTRIIQGKRKLTSLVAIMAVISMVIIGVTLSMLYDSAFEQERARLIDTVKRQASLIRAVARYDQEAEPRMKEENPEHDAFEATLSQLREAHENFEGFGETGEFTMAKLEGDQIVFLLSHRHDDLTPSGTVPISSHNAEPMRLALSGESGSVVGCDYRGEQVLAAYEPVKELGLGIVAKIDISEIRLPYIRAGLILLGLAIVPIFFGAMLLILISKPIISDIIEKETRLRDITTTMPGCVYQFVLRKDGTVAMPYLSDAYEEITGIKAGTLKQDAAIIYDFIHYDDRASFKESIGLSAETMTPWDHEFRIVTPDRGTIWLHGRSNPGLLADGSICWNGVLTNITERKQAEEILPHLVEATSFKFGRAFFNSMALQLSKALNADYTLIGELSGNNDEVISTIAVAVDGKLVDNFSYDIAGTPCANVVGQSICCYVSGITYEFPEDKLLKDMGVEGYIGMPLFDSQRNALGILAVLYRKPVVKMEFKEAILQIFSSQIGSELERSRTDKALFESGDKLMRAQFMARIGDFTWDIARSGINFSDGMYALLKYDKNEALDIKKVYAETIYPDDLDRVSKWLKGCIASGEEVLTPNELRLTCRNGEVIWVQTEGRFESKNGKPIRLFGICQDITETKRLQELESRAERLETAGTIAGQVAHDFNNLLAPIMAYPDFIREELSHDNQAHAFLDAIESAGQKITSINQDLLTMGRRGHYNLEVLNLNQIVVQAAKEMDSRTKTVTCEIDLCQDLMKIKGGAAQIHRALTNLLVNAQDAMEDTGQIAIKTENYYADDTFVGFSRVPKGEYVKLSISDTGCGIPDDMTQKILDPFFTTKMADKKRGSGLGLSVVDAVMKDHHGYLNVSSKVGVGTTFCLYFPVTREDLAEEDFEHFAGGTETILVVDDDNVQREVLTQLLTRLGYKVNTVQSGEEAIEFLTDNPHNLVILDMVMPGGIDGTETYRRILENSPNQKAIILSGFSESDRVHEVQKLGAGAFVRKPVSRTIIATAVKKELDRQVEIVAS